MKSDRVRRWFGASPVLVRVGPFLLFVGMTSLQGRFHPDSAYWIYLAKSLAGLVVLGWVWPWVREMRWALSRESVVVGVAVFIAWVGLDGYYPALDRVMGGAISERTIWNPHAAFGQNSFLAWMFIAVRLVGSSLIVPPLEEVFYRSFLYRYIIDPDFLKVSFRCFHRLAFFLTPVIFGLAHFEWLPGILCGLAYQGLVIWKGRLGDAMTAHAITNLLLGLWVVTEGAWRFW